MAKKKTKNTKKSKKKAAPVSSKKRGTAKGQSMQAKLKAMQKGWSKAEPAQGGFPVPDGSYAVRIISAILEQARKSARLQINWEMQVIEPANYAGKIFHKYAGIDTDESLPYVQGDLEALELEIPDSIVDIGVTLESAAGLVCEVGVRTKAEFTNVDFVELVEEGDLSGDEDEDEDEDEDADEDTEGEEEEEEEDEEEAEDDDELSEDDINEMKRGNLVKLIEEQNLETDPDDHKSVKALRAVVIEELF